MSNFKGGRRGGRYNKQNRNNESEKSKLDIDENNPIIAIFKVYAKELDDKHDRYERIVKLGRDITIESKRIIFLLHTIDPKKNNIEKVLADAKIRLDAICEVNFKEIAREIGHLDQYQYARAYSPGLQEFIEAYTFYEYLSNSKLSDWDGIQAKLVYIPDDVKKEKVEGTKEKDNESESEKKDSISDDTSKVSENLETEEENQVAVLEIKPKVCLVKPIEYMLGLADFTGEIMRRCINSLGSKDIDACFECCKTLKALYSCFVRLGHSGNRDLPRKITTLRQSLLKTENVCYNIKVRGREAVTWNTVEGFNTEKASYEEDEGFY